MTDLTLSDEAVQGIASKYALEEIEGEKTAEELAAEETAAAAAEATKLAEAEAAAKRSEDGGDNQKDEDEDEDEPTPISHLIKQYGYKPEDFEDIDIKDDSVEGIKKFYDKRDELVKEAAKKEFLSTDPDIEDLIKHKQEGGSIETWKAKKQAAEFNLEFKADDIDGKSNFLVDVYKQKGLSEKRAKLLVEGLKDDDELDAEVEKEAGAIKVYLQQQADQRIAAEKEVARIEQEEITKTVTQVNSIIKEGNLQNLVIPETDRKAFNEFVLSEKLTEKHEKLTLQQRLFIDYLVYKDFKVKGIEKQVATSSNKQTPRVRMSATTGGDGGTEGKEWTLDELRAKTNKTQ